MIITNLYIYPIKSLRGISLPTTTLTEHGFPFDRRFMLVRVHPPASATTPEPKPRWKDHFNAETRLENMTITYWPELSLFRQALINGEGEEGGGQKLLELTHPKAAQAKRFPLQPEHGRLKEMKTRLHNSPATGFAMPDDINDWFSDCLGVPTQLIYLGSSRRPVLGNLSPNPQSQLSLQQPSSSWISSVSSLLPSSLTQKDEDKSNTEITFTDCAPYLVLTSESVADISSRLVVGKQMDITKLRPNIVVSGSPAPYEEDFWSSLLITSPTTQISAQLLLTQNCGRCQSLDVDYSTGKFGKGEEGTVLKKLMGDRRVDEGNKWSPICGRYGFLDVTGGKGGGDGERGDGKVEREIKVGDEVEVTRRNEERTRFKWPGIGNG